MLLFQHWKSRAQAVVLRAPGQKEVASNRPQWANEGKVLGTEQDMAASTGCRVPEMVQFQQYL